jgi:hypothetical protein
MEWEGEEDGWAMWRMKLIVLVMLLAAAPWCGAAGLDGPKLSDGLPARNLFDPNRLLTTGNVAIGPSQTFTLAPQFGLGYFNWEREPRRGMAESLYSLNAQAGGRLDLLDMFYFTALAKLPVYSYDVLDRRLASAATSQERTVRHQYDLFRVPGDNVTWTGEFGLKLGQEVDLNLFYDQTRFGAPQVGTTPGQAEERFGTRFTIHFK